MCIKVNVQTTVGGKEETQQHIFRTAAPVRYLEVRFNMSPATNTGMRVREYES